MILSDPNVLPQDGERTTLDDLFRIAGVRNPDGLALCDPPNRAAFTEGAPRRLTYAQADQAVSAIAGRLRRLGLSSDAVVALQLPNTVESVLTLLGVLRAGMIAAPLPLLWRRADAAAALNRIGAKAIITTSRIGRVDHGALATSIAAEVFPIRYVCSFGSSLADGVIPFDDLLEKAPLLDPPSPVERTGPAAAHVAAVTFETTPEGLMAVARNHSELIAGGRAIRLEVELEDSCTITTACPATSFAGLATSTLSWLITGGTLSLYHPIDAAAFAEQCSADKCDTVVVPGPMATRFAQAGLLSHPELRQVIGLWRAPERLAIDAPWRHSALRLFDVLAFGETAILCGSRSASGEPAELPLGTVSPDVATPAVTETMATASGTLAIRGAMVPHHAFPPGADRAPMASLRPDPNGFIDTRYPCRADRGNGVLQVTGPPPGIVSIGGYRFAADKLHALAAAAPDASLAILPDAIAGHRLAGNAVDRAAIRDALDQCGVNPLVSGAFLERRRSEAA